GNLTWGAGSTLRVDPGATTGGILKFSRTAGNVVVGAGAAMNILNGATVELAGTENALSSGTVHVSVANDGLLHVSAGAKDVGAITGGGTTTADATTTLNAASIRQDTLNVNGKAAARANGTTSG